MTRKWWKEAVVYQVYPFSFCDSNGDGIGDLKGITSKLDYIKELGVDVIWMSPVLKSGVADGGYDHIDYYDIQDHFGTIADWEELLAEVHKRGMKLLMDVVMGYTSHENPWFIDSRSSSDNEKRDYYIWRDGKDGKEPSNWEGIFKLPAWAFDEKTGQYYFNTFGPGQPDLNWHNPKVRKEMHNMMKFWLDKGVDGFRLDVSNSYIKNPAFPDNPTNGSTDRYIPNLNNYFNQTGIHECIREMNREVLSKYDIMTVGEAEMVTVEMALEYVAEDRNEYNTVIQFEIMHMDEGPGGWFNLVPWKLSTLKKIISDWESGMREKGWNSWYLNNHDQPRMVSRYGNDGKYRVESAKMLATLLHTLQGTPLMYQGEELGMTNVKFDSIDEYKDPFSLNHYRKEIKPDKSNYKDLMESIYVRGRDNARTPFQWNDKDNAGFTTGTPWLKVNPNYKEINAEKALADNNSVYYYYKKLLELRKQNLIMVYGEYIPLMEENEQIFTYLRKLDEDRLLVILNFYEPEVEYKLPKEIEYTCKELLISNYDVSSEEDIRNIRLRPYEARVYRLI